MRDPLSWSIPLGRLFGVTVRVHLLFPIFILGMVGRAAWPPKWAPPEPPGMWVEACILMGLLFVAVFLHELGHVFAARSVDGDAGEVMLWPAGGLIAAEVPSTPRAYLVAAAGGPLVNLALAVGVSLALLSAHVVPDLRPWSNPCEPVVYSWDHQAYLGSKLGHGDWWRFKANDQPVWPDDVRWVSSSGLDKPEFVRADPDADKGAEKGTAKAEDKKPAQVQAEVVDLHHGRLIVLASQVFWVNWVLLLLNLVPAFPLDGGRLLQSALWWRSDYRQGTLAAIFAGFVVMFLCVLLSIIVYDPLVLLLAIIVYLFCRRQWIVLETGGEESLFGYDFSQGYTSLEREAVTPPPPKRRQSWLQRWLRQRAEKRMRREQETREAEERRMDELLEKVQRVGLQGLTEEERRFMTRVSARYRNRQE